MKTEWQQCPKTRKERLPSFSVVAKRSPSDASQTLICKGTQWEKNHATTNNSTRASNRQQILLNAQLHDGAYALVGSATAATFCSWTAAATSPALVSSAAATSSAAFSTAATMEDSVALGVSSEIGASVATSVGVTAGSTRVEADDAPLLFLAKLKKLNLLFDYMSENILMDYLT